MGKKQIRVTNPESNTTDFLNKMVTLVLINNTVVFGKLISNNDRALVLKNMRLKKITIPITDVVEFYVDIDA